MAEARYQYQNEPLPIAQSFVLCRDIIENAKNGEFILIGPLNRLRVPETPSQVRMSIYAHLTNGHGKYRVGLELRNPAGEPTWNWVGPKQLDMPHPLHPHEITLYDAVMEFYETGRHDMVLMINDKEAMHHSLDVYE